jgi:hypothetical protein
MTRQDDKYLRQSSPMAARPRTAGRYRPVIELLRRTFGDDLAACQRCGGRMRLVALVKDQQSIDRFLRGIGQGGRTARVHLMASAR